MRIRSRLAWFGVMVAGLTMLLFGLLINWLATAAAPEDQDRRLEETVNAAALSISSRPEVLGQTPLFVSDQTTGTDLFVEMVTEDGTHLYTTGLIDGEPLRIPAAVLVEAVDLGSAVATIRTPDGVAFRVHAAPARVPEVGTVVVVAAQSTTAPLNELRGLRFLLLAAGVVTVLAAGLVSWLVGGRALRPLHQLAATTEEIERTGDVSRRLPDSRSKDIVGRLTRSFNAMMDRVAATIESQRRFMADASHELRTPLTTIRSNAGFLAERHDVSEADHREALIDIASEAARLNRLVDDLLSLARTDLNTSQPLVPIDLGLLAEEAVRKVRPVAGEIDIDIQRSATVMGDADQLTRLVVILLDNAARHGAGRIELSVRNQDGTVALTVADRGPGISEEDLDRVFERFYRSDPARSGEGSGLGLSIAREIVVSHHGMIEARNREDGGTVFEASFTSA